MKIPHLEKIAALAATGAVLGYADPALAQAAAVCSEVNWPKALVSVAAIIGSVFAIWAIWR